MAKLVLAGGTDVAEMALFDVDALVRDRPPDLDSLTEMENRRAALRFPSGSDGGYLLHAYVDEPVPADLLKYCSVDDRKSAILDISAGNVGFGGIESLYSSFAPNPNIRADAQVPAGSYDVTAYRTEYPDELVEDAVRGRIGPRGARIENMPGFAIPIGLVSTMLTFFAFGWIAAVFVALIAVSALVIFFRSPQLKRLSHERRQAELAYPSIVVHMRSKNT
jgi:hypothetical protein